MDLTADESIWSFYVNFSGYFSELFVWLILFITFVFHVIKRKKLMWLSAIILVNQLFNHLIAGYLFTAPLVWNIAWIVSDALLIYLVYRKIQYFNVATKQDIAVMGVTFIAALINFARYIERLYEYYEVDYSFSIKPFYGVGINTVNLIIIMVLITPIIKSLLIYLKDYSNANVFVDDRAVGRNDHSSPN